MTYLRTFHFEADGNYIIYAVVDALGWFEVARWMIPGTWKDD